MDQVCPFPHSIRFEGGASPRLKELRPLSREAVSRTLLISLLLSVACPSTLSAQGIVDEINSFDARIKQFIGVEKFAEAIPLEERILAIGEQAFGPNDPKLYNTISYLADLYEHSANYERAEALLLRAISLRESAPGSKDLPITSALSRCGACRAMPKPMKPPIE